MFFNKIINSIQFYNILLNSNIRENQYIFIQFINFIYICLRNERDIDFLNKKTNNN